MRAVVKERPGPGMGYAVQVPDPVRQPGEALLRPLLAGICGTDLHIEAWEGPYRDLAPYLPFVLGHEFVAEVVEGERLRPGQRVVAMSLYGCGQCSRCLAGQGNLCGHARPTAVGMAEDGGMAELLALPEERLLVVPESVSLRSAALTEPFATALRAVDRAPGIKWAGRILVLGPGTIGLMVALAVRAYGPAQLVVAGTERDGERLDLAARLGFDTVTLGEESLSEADLVFEAAGAPAAVTSGLAALAPQGRLVVIGMHAEPVAIPLDAVVRGERHLTGSYASTPADWERALFLLGSGRVDLDALAGPIFPLEQAEAAFAAVSRGVRGRVLLRCSA